MHNLTHSLLTFTPFDSVCKHTIKHTIISAKNSRCKCELSMYYAGDDNTPHVEYT